MSPLFSQFKTSPLKERLNNRPGFFFAHRLKEINASSGTEYKRAFLFRLHEYFRDGRIQSLTNYVLPLDQGKGYHTFVLEHEDQVVATVTLFIPVRESLWKIEAMAEFFRERKLDTVEIKNLVIHPEFRGTDVINHIFGIVHRELVRSSRKYLVTSCTQDLIPKYEEIAFEETGITFPREYGRPDELHLLMSCQYRFGAYGLHVGPLKWGVFLSTIAAQIDYNHALPQKIILGIYSCLTPLALTLYRFKIYFRWLRWTYKHQSSPNISSLRFLRMLGLL